MLSPAATAELSCWILPRIEKDRPFGDLGFDEDTAGGPRIVAEELGRLVFTAGLHDEQNATVVRVRAAEDDEALFKEAIHEDCVLGPERLLATWHAWQPRGTGVPKNEEKCAGHFASGLSGSGADFFI
jgi:hypothetical protein